MKRTQRPGLIIVLVPLLSLGAATKAVAADTTKHVVTEQSAPMKNMDWPQRPCPNCP